MIITINIPVIDSKEIYKESIDLFFALAMLFAQHGNNIVLCDNDKDTGDYKFVKRHTADDTVRYEVHMLNPNEDNMSLAWGDTYCEALVKHHDSLLRLFTKRGHEFSEIIHRKAPDIISGTLAMLMARANSIHDLTDVWPHMKKVGGILAQDISDLSLEGYIDAWILNWHERAAYDEHVFIINTWPPRVSTALCITRLQHVVNIIENTKAGRIASSNVTGSTAPINIVVSPDVTGDNVVLYRCSRARGEYDFTRILADSCLSKQVIEVKDFVITVRPTEEYQVVDFIKAATRPTIKT